MWRIFVDLEGDADSDYDVNDGDQADGQLIQSEPLAQVKLRQDRGKGEEQWRKFAPERILDAQVPIVSVRESCPRQLQCKLCPW